MLFALLFARQSTASARSQQRQHAKDKSSRCALPPNSPHRPRLLSTATADSNSSNTPFSIGSTLRADRMGNGHGSFTGSTFIAAADSSSSRIFTLLQQHQTSIITTVILSQHGEGKLPNNFFSQRCLRTQTGSGSEPDHSIHKSQLTELGFAEDEAACVLSYYAHRKLAPNIQNVAAWLQLLQSLHVEHASHVISKRRIVLSSKAATAITNTEGIVEWLTSVKATHEMIVKILTREPLLLTVPHTTPAAAAAWLHSSFGWSDSTITNVLMMVPQVFRLSCNKLAGKLDWLQSKGLRTDTISKMVRAQPQLLLHDFSSIINRTKLHYFTDVMKSQLLECLPFCTYSLSETIGPRSAFHSLYCQDQPFNLNTRLKCNDGRFLRQLPSPSLDAVCASRGITRQQLYAEFKASRQQADKPE